MIQVKVFYFNELRVCCYVVWDETKECVIIDPGCFSDNELSRLVKFVNDNDLKPVKLLLTHGHFDHVMGLADVAHQWNLTTYVHPDDIGQIKRATRYCSMFGWKIKEPDTERIDLQDNQEVTFGNSKLEVIHTPGHTQGGVCFYNEEQNILFSGDTLFAGSIGRTDHPGGNYDQLMKSIRTKIMILPENTTVYPGHGLETTIGQEIKSNPFLQ
ncbi:MAG: MBL fold metallo-hydrolase [Bacteroidales bacterium]|nr:MBL fold metallo-hydrolase [Bacteroidales bacterium]MDD4671077.1 MBL fold metallo-hydrolase [Bacteroidales bacterium]